MLKKLGVTLGVLVLLLVAFIASRPSTFKVERSVRIKASPAQLSAFITDFHAWSDWSPWAKLDPAMKTTYSGPATGVGAVYEWSGNSDVGSGKMTITDVKPNQLVGIDIAFLTPIAATNHTEFELTPEAELTNLTWRMTGTNNFMAKAFGVVMNMDQMIGGDFERGLAVLKALAEAAAVKAATPAPAPEPMPEPTPEPAAAGEPGADAGT